MSESAANVVNGLTFDVEDYFHVTALASAVHPAQWDSMESRVERNTERLLELLAARETRATFFVLGWVAQRNPALVRTLQRAGHEVACHGLTHQLVYTQTPKVFHEETLRAKSLLEDLTGERIRGYRAATYSITNASLWALDILQELGFQYDSSIYPIRHDLYGIPGAPRFAYQAHAGGLLEIPLTTVRIFGLQIPCGGGGYFRLLPYSVFRWTVRRVNAFDRQPAVFYSHPWEIDPEQPRIEGVSRRSRFRHYLNLSATQGRLSRLLSDFKWGRMDEIFGFN